MDNDAVRSSGDRTLVDMWIDGRFRTVSITRAAIEAHLRLPSDRAAAMTDEDRREFVRANLKLLASAATDIVRQTDPDAKAVAIDVGDWSGTAPRPAGDRRQSDRRRGVDRRKASLGPPPSGERRKGGDQRG